MTLGNYRVTLALGYPGAVHAWDITDEDPAEYGPTAGLTITRKLIDGKPWPAHPDHSVASFGLIVADGEDLPGLVQGAPVSIAFHMPRNNPDAAERFDGRVSDVTFAPHALGGVFAVTCVDYLTDLTEVQIGAGDWEAEDTLERLTRMWDEAAAEDPTLAPWLGLEDTDEFTPYADREARAGSRTAFYPLLLALLETFYDDYHNGRYRVAPTFTGAGVTSPRTLAGFTGVFVPELAPADDLPGVFGETAPGEYGVVIAEDTALDSKLIHGDHVDMGAQWKLRKGDTPTRIEVTGTSGWVEAADNGETPRVAYRIESDLDLPLWGRKVAALYLPEAAPSPWVVETFTWYLAEEPYTDAVDIDAWSVRFYLSSGGDAVTISPTFGAGWDETGDAVRRFMDVTPSDTATVAFALEPAGAGDVLVVQHVEALGPFEMPAGTLPTGDFEWLIPAESTTEDTDRWQQCRIAVYNEDGTVHRGDLFTGVATVAGSTDDGDPNYIFGTPGKTRLLLGDLAAVPGVQATDRFVFESGWRTP